MGRGASLPPPIPSHCTAGHQDVLRQVAAKSIVADGRHHTPQRGRGAVAGEEVRQEATTDNGCPTQAGDVQ